MRQRNGKYIIVGMLVIFAVILGVRQTHFQSVDSYRQEQRQLAKDVSSDSGDNELESMYDTSSPDSTGTAGDDQGKGSGAKQVTSSKKPKIQKDQEGHKTSASMKPSEMPESEKSSGSQKKSSTNSAQKKKSSKNGSGTKTSDKNKSNRKPSNKKPEQNSSQPSASSVADNSSQNTPGSTAGQDGTEENNGTSTPSESREDSATGPSATGKPQAEQITCTIEIRCDSLVENKKQAQQSIWKYIPSDGQILEKVSVKVDKGSGVYDVLEKACKAKGVAVDATYTPMYKSYYIKGIGNIYEKQAGDMSGWIYKVNGTAPNRGASAYKVSDGDAISWYYTCDGKTT